MMMWLTAAVSLYIIAMIGVGAGVIIKLEENFPKITPTIFGVVAAGIVTYGLLLALGTIFLLGLAFPHH